MLSAENYPHNFRKLNNVSDTLELMMVFAQRNCKRFAICTNCFSSNICVSGLNCQFVSTNFQYLRVALPSILKIKWIHSNMKDARNIVRCSCIAIYKQIAFTFPMHTIICWNAYINITIYLYYSALYNLMIHFDWRECNKKWRINSNLKIAFMYIFSIVEEVKSVKRIAYRWSERGKREGCDRLFLPFKLFIRTEINFEFLSIKINRSRSIHWGAFN